VEILSTDLSPLLFPLTNSSQLEEPETTTERWNQLLGERSEQSQEALEFPAPFKVTDLVVGLKLISHPADAPSEDFVEQILEGVAEVWYLIHVATEKSDAKGHLETVMAWLVLPEKVTPFLTFPPH